MLNRKSLNCLEETVGINVDLRGDCGESSERSKNHRESFISSENTRVAINGMFLEIRTSKVLLVSPHTAMRNMLLCLEKR